MDVRRERGYFIPSLFLKFDGKFAVQEPGFMPEAGVIIGAGVAMAGGGGVAIGPDMPVAGAGVIIGVGVLMSAAGAFISMSNSLSTVAAFTRPP